MKNDFLPKDYELPTKEGGYMKFKQGENQFRIMDSPILGYVYWNEDSEGNRKPVRARMEEQIDISQVDDPGQLRHFWAMVVWNYEAKKLQVLEITQKGIMKSLKTYAADKDWGNPKGTEGYDIVVIREGEKLETKYQVSTKPKKELDKAVTKLYAEADINLDALYKGEDPFAQDIEIDVEDIDKILDE